MSAQARMKWEGHPCYVRQHGSERYHTNACSPRVGPPPWLLLQRQSFPMVGSKVPAVVKSATSFADRDSEGECKGLRDSEGECNGLREVALGSARS